MLRARLVVFLLCTTLVVLQCGGGVWGLKSELSINNDPRRAIDVASFGFIPGGYLKLRFENFDLSLPAGQTALPSDRYKVGFVVHASPRDPQEIDEMSECMLDEGRVAEDDQIVGLEMPLSEWLDNYEFEKNINKGAMYNVIFYNCEPETTVTFDLYVDEKNPGHYLSAGLVPLPAIYALFAALYVVCIALFVFFLRQKEAEVYRIHHLMLVVVCLKALSLTVNALRYHYMDSTGAGHANSTGWDIAYYIVVSAKGIAFFAALVLIGSGWSFVKAYLSDRDRRIFTVVIVVQVIFSVALVVFDEEAEGTKGRMTWFDIIKISDIVCCAILLIPIAQSIKHLKDASQVEGKGTANTLSLKTYRRYYVAVVAWVYFTRIVVYLVRLSVSYNLVWTASFASEAATLAFVVYTGYTFRPVPGNKALSIARVGSDDDNDDAPLIINGGGTVIQMQRLDMVSSSYDDDDIEIEIV